MPNIVCLNHNNYCGRGSVYVERLYHGIKRHLSKPFEFTVLTERDLPDGAQGWWNKIYLFQPNRFKGRVLYFDLDTVITGSLDEIASCQASFAALSDIYHPERLASGVMAWEAGAADHIWTRWTMAGQPQFDPRGDQGWIEAMMPNAERLQTLFPKQIVSFKKDCLDGLPEGARVVAFHGLPRPHVLHDLMAQW